MKLLIKKIKELQDSPVNDLANQRIKEFESFKNKNNSAWFSELCFCILAANSKQKTSENIQKKLGSKLKTMPQQELATFIRDNKHRFHNNKSKYIVEARRYSNVKKLINGKSESEARDWLADNIKGLGMKEASHFLRNTGSKDIAILDRHILSLMDNHNLIDQIPTSLTKKHYLLIESKFIKLANKLQISPAKLDLLMWYLKTKEVAK